MIRFRCMAGALSVALGCLMAVGVAQAQDQPSLGELARRNKEKKAQQDATKSKKVYGAEDLPKAPPGSESSASTATPAASADSSTAADSGESQAAAPAAEGGEQPPASPEAQDAQAALDRAKADEAAVEKNIEKLQKQLETETSEFRRNLYQESLDRSKENLAAYRAKREEAEKAAAAAGSGKKPEGQPPPQ
jgi:cytoskeletal protein RodZ